jgi:hypothetical protein
MRVSARLLGVCVAAIAASSWAQPYGLLENSPGYWNPLGQFDTAIDGEHTGHTLAFTHYGYNADPKTFSAISVLQAYDEEQLRPGHGSYWQAWIFVTVKCGQGSFRITDAHFYNKPRFPGSSADELWVEKYVPENSNMLDDKFFKKAEPATLGDAVVKAACAEPVGTNI